MSKQLSEQELVAGCAKNDRRCQEQLYRRFFQPLLAVCKRYAKDEDEAMHVLNTGMLKAFQRIDQFTFKGSLEGWLRRIVYHSMVDQYRASQRELRFLVFEEWDAPLGTQEHDLLYQDLLQHVNRLPTMTQKVFKLYAIEGYNHREIGELLGMSNGTSKWHLSEARKKLKDWLSIDYPNYLSNEQ